jgi:Putative zinc-finger
MSALTCAQVRELAPELALGVLGGAERAETIMHVNGCARCQAYVLELTEAADALPLLAPEIEPPAGFEHRVLTEIRVGSRRSRRRGLAALAAVAAAVAIISITVVRVIESSGSSPSSSSVAAAANAKPVAVQMHGGVGEVPAGWAYVTGGHEVAVSVAYGVEPNDYQVRVKPAGGTAEILGTMTIEDGRGSWTGRSTSTLGAGSTIGLVGPDGHEVCHGTVTATQ